MKPCGTFSSKVRNRAGRLLVGVLAVLVTHTAGWSTQFRTAGTDRSTWVQGVEPFRLLGNIYYVGTGGISSFLITTPDGHILLDTGYEENVTVIRDSIRELGLDIDDIELLITSHAHGDHVGGHAAIRELSGTKVLASAADAPAIARGGQGEGSPALFEIDRIIRDKEEITLGGVTLTAHLTPGHTPGCTTWTMVSEEGDLRYDILFHCSTSFSPGVRLTGDPAHPTRGADFRKSFSVLKSLLCDVLLLPHGHLFDLVGKMERLKNGESPNPFIDATACRNYIERSEREFGILEQQPQPVPE